MSLLTFTLRRASVHAMALARVRGCAGRGLSEAGVHAGKPMPAAGETAHVRRLLVDRSRCGLEVSPAPPEDTGSSGTGRRAVVAIEAANPSAGGCGDEDQVGRASAALFNHAARAQTGRNRTGRGIVMEIIVTGRHITVPPRFRQHAAAKLAKLEKLDAKAVRIDVEVSKERNPRQSDRRERVELTIRSRGPAIRAEAAADDRYAALDLAFAKLESRLRRASDRRKVRRGDLGTVRSPGPAGRPRRRPRRRSPARPRPAGAPRVNGNGANGLPAAHRRPGRPGRGRRAGRRPGAHPDGG